jgi:VanZ family protein
MSVTRWNTRRLSLWAPVALYMMVIFWLSSISRPPDLPGAVSDKAAHVFLYSGLGALLVRARAGGWRRPVTLGIATAAIVVATLYGISDEIHQSFVPLRQVEVRDVLADALGASLAAGALYAWSRIANTKRPRAVTAEDLRARARSAEAKQTRGV